MKAKELTKLTREELQSRLSEKRKELRDSEFDIRIGQTQDFNQKLKLRKEVARILTLLNNNLFATESQEPKKSKPAAVKTSKTSDKSAKITKPAGKSEKTKTKSK
jgi:ribosomal protein L29